MSRLANYLFTLCSVASVLLCAAACALWARSCWHVDQFNPSGLPILKEGSWLVTSRDGRVRVSAFHGLSWAENLGSQNWERNRVVFSMGEMGPPSTRLPEAGVFIRERRVAVPYWPVSILLALSAAALAAPRHHRARRRRREAAGLCPSCGYDLRASPGRCPECGAVPEVTT